MDVNEGEVRELAESASRFSGEIVCGFLIADYNFLKY